MDSSNRRGFVKLLGAVAAASGVAGCSQIPGSGGDTGAENGDGTGDGSGDGGRFGGGELPSYASWMPKPADDPPGDPYLLMGVSAKTFKELQSKETETPTPEVTPTTTPTPGALVRNPLVSMVAILFAVGLGLGSSFGLSTVASGKDSPTDQFLYVERAWVLLGSYDPDALSEKVGEKGLSEEGTVGDLTLYTSENGNRAIAIGDSAIVFATEDNDRSPVERVTAVASVGAGDAESVADSDAFAWALRTAGGKGATFGTTTTDEALETTATPTPTPSDGGGGGFPELGLELFRGAKAGVQSLTSSDGKGSAVAAIAYPEGEDVPTERLKELAVSSNKEVEVRTRGNRAILKTTWTFND